MPPLEGSLADPSARGHRKRTAMVRLGLAGGRDDRTRILRGMLIQTLRFLMLRALPRKLLPFLTAIELFRLVRRMRRRTPQPVAPRRIVTADTPDLPAR